MSGPGFRKFIIKKKTEEAPGVFSFVLALADGHPLPLHEPGQYLSFRFSVPGENRPLLRSYSLSENSGKGKPYRITIKKDPLRPGDSRKVSGSTYICDHWKVGDSVEARGPEGLFNLDRDSKLPAVFVAGGIGITPILSMLLELAEVRSQREIYLFFGVRSSRAHLFRSLLEDLAERHSNFHLHITYSQPQKDDVWGRDYNQPGRISLDTLKKKLPSKDNQYYICGPCEMIDDLRNGLADWGVGEDQIFFELFGPPKPPPAPTKPPAKTERRFTVTFSKSGTSAEWVPGAGSILDLAEKCGIPVDYSCRAGECGTCSLFTTSGELAMYGAADEALGPGLHKTCCSFPKTDLTVDA